MAITFRASSGAQTATNDLVMTYPTGAVAGDIALLAVSSNLVGDPTVVPAGWTKLGTTISSSSMSAYVWWRVIQAGDPGNTFTMSWGVVGKRTGQVVVYSGGNAAAPIDAYASNTLTSAQASLNHTTPTITVVTSGARLVEFVADKFSPGSTSISAPSTFTRRDNQVQSGSGSMGAAIGDSNSTYVPGAAGGDVWISNVSSQQVNFTIALAPGGTTDSTPPTVPANVTAVANSATQVTLTWSASTDDSGVASYRVRQGGADVTGATALTGTSAVITGLTASTAYSFTVSALDTAGNRSGESTAATVNTPPASDITPPTVPTGVTATADSAGQVTISWTASTDANGVASYRIRRFGVDLVGATAVTTTSYADKSVAESTTYSYTVSAVDLAGNRSAESATVTATTPAAGPATSPGDVTLTFENGTDGATITTGSGIDVVTGTPTWATSAAVHGTLGMTGAAGAAANVIVNPLSGWTGDHTGSIYIRPRAIAAGAVRVVALTNTANAILATIRLNTTGTFQISDSASTALATSTLHWAADTVYRLDWQYVVSTKVMTVRIFTTPEGTTPAETISATTNSGAFVLQRFAFSATQSSGSGDRRVDVDTVRLYNGVAAWPAPYLGTGGGGGGTPPATPGTVLHSWAGAPTPTGFTVRAKVSATSDLRLVVSTSPSMTSPITGSVAAVDADGYATFAVTGLPSATVHYYQVSDAGTLIGSVGKVKTLPVAGSASSFKFALSACITTNAADPSAINSLVAWDPDFNVFTGDFHYQSITATTSSTHRAAYETQINGAAGLKAALAAHPWIYTVSDHEAGADNGDSNNAWTAANIAAYRQVVPHLPIAASDPTRGRWQTFVVGRVRFIVLDIRNLDRSPGLNADSSAKTMLGAEQKAWLKARLLDPEPVKVIVSDVAWLGAASTTNGEDKWWSYAIERQEIADFITTNGVKVVLMHGDSHALGVATPAANTWGGFPVYCSAPIHNTGGGRNLANFTSYWNNTGGNARVYARITVTDTGTAITFAYSGWDAVGNVERIAQTDTFTVDPPVDPPTPTDPAPAPTPVPVEPTPVDRQLQVSLYDQTYARLGQVGNYVSCEASWQYMGVGTGTLVVEEDDPIAPYLLGVNQELVGVVIDVDDDVRWSGRVSSALLERQGPPGSGTITATLVSDWIWLHWMLASQNAANASLNGMPQFDTRIGPAASVAAAYINAAAARLALPVWASTPAGDSSLTVSLSARMTRLADLLTDPLVYAGVNMDATIWLPGDTQPDGVTVPLTKPTVVFAPKLLADKPWLQWTDSMTSVEQVRLQVNHPTAYRAIVGLAGEDAARVYDQVVDGIRKTAVGTYGLPETYVDASDAALGAQSQTAGALALYDAAGTGSASFVVADAAPWVFGRDYVVGDLATVVVSDTTWRQRITRVTVQDSRDGGLSFVPLIGNNDPDVSAGEIMAVALAKVAASLRSIQTGK